MLQSNEVSLNGVSLSAAAKVCPNCGDGALTSGEKFISIGDTLKRWERAVDIRFSADVWRNYEEIAGEPVSLCFCQRCHFSVFLPVVVGSDAFYSEISASEQEYYVGERWEFSRAIRDLRRHGCRRILDYGCGSGAFLSQLKDDLGIDAHGFELNPRARQTARERGHKIIDSIEPGAVVQEPFDAICMFQILEHLSDPFGMIDRLRELLRPGGLLIVTMPNSSGPIRHFSDSLTELPPHHVTRWDDVAVRVCAERRGFRLSNVSYEPLPDYLWGSYLPVMLERDLLPATLGRALNRLHVTTILVAVLRRLGMKYLWPVRGHTLYAAMLVRSDAEIGARINKCVG